MLTPPTGSCSSETWQMRSFLAADPTVWEDGSFPSLWLFDPRASTLFAPEFIVAFSPVPLKYDAYFYSASLQQLLNTPRVPQEKGMDLTWSYPGCDFNLHAKEELSFGGIQCFLLVLLLPEEHEPIALLGRAVDLHRRHLPVLLEFVEKSIFKACI